MKLLGGAAVSALAAGAAPRALAEQNTGSRGGAPAGPAGRLSKDDLAFLEEMQHAGCMFFYEQADPVSGQVLDRAANKVSTGAMDPARRIASIAATGFGLSALCIADQRHYLPTAQIRQRVQADAAVPPEPDAAPAWVSVSLQ